MEERGGSEGQSHREENREGGTGMGRGSRALIAYGGNDVLEYLCRGPRVPSYVTANGASLPT